MLSRRLRPLDWQLRGVFLSLFIELRRLPEVLAEELCLSLLTRLRPEQSLEECSAGGQHQIAASPHDPAKCRLHSRSFIFMAVMGHQLRLLLHAVYEVVDIHEPHKDWSQNC